MDQLLWHDFRYSPRASREPPPPEAPRVRVIDRTRPARGWTPARFTVPVTEEITEWRTP